MSEDTSDIQSVGTGFSASPSEPAAAAAATDPAPPATPAASAEQEPAPAGEENKTDPPTPEEPDVDAEDAPRPGETPQQASARKRGRLQQRIDDITKARYTAEGQLTQAQAEVERLRAELDRTRGGGDRRTSAPTPGGDPGDKPAPRSAPDQIAQAFEQQHPKPTVDDFASYDEYVDKLTDWKRDQGRFVDAELAHLERRQQAQRRHYESVQTRGEAFKTQHPDFDAQLASLSDLHIHRGVMTEIESLEHGHAVMYTLATDRATREQFETLTPAGQLRFIGRLEDKLAAKPPAAPAPKPKPVTRAPAPLEPEGGPSASARRLEDMTTDERLDFWAAERERTGR